MLLTVPKTALLEILYCTCTEQPGHASLASVNVECEQPWVIPTNTIPTLILPSLVVN